MRFIILITLLAATAVQAQTEVKSSAGGPAATKFDIDASHSAVEFTVRFMGLTKVRGRFADFAGTVMYVDEDPTKSTVTLVIDAASIDTDVEHRDNDLRKNFFEVERFPKIVFRSQAIERAPDGYLVRGTLAMHGVTRNVGLSMRQLHGRMKDGWANVRIGFEGTLSLNRKDYGVVGGAFWNRVIDLDRLAVADTVTIELGIQAEISNFELWGFGAEPGRRSIGERLVSVVGQNGAGSAVQLYTTLRRDSTSAYTFRRPQLNVLGYKLLQQGKVSDAVAIFQLNTQEYPDSSNVWDSLGEAQAAAGSRAAATASYEKSLALDPWNYSAMEMLRWLK